MNRILFNPTLGTLKIIKGPEGEEICKLIEDFIYDICRIVIDDIPYKFYIKGSLKSKVDSKIPWSFYQVSTDKCIYGGILIEALDAAGNSKDITAEDILRIRSHIVVRTKGYMIYLD